MLRKAAKPGEERNYLAELAAHHQQRQLTPTELLGQIHRQRQRGPSRQGNRSPKPSSPTSLRKPSARPSSGPLNHPFDRLDRGDFRP
jgi:hypothetical protein